MPEEKIKVTPSGLTAIKGADLGTLTASDLSGGGSSSNDFEIPPTPTPTNFGGSIAGNLQTLLSNFNQGSEAETKSGDIQNLILSTLGELGGESAKKTELETGAGLPTQRTDLQNVINQLTTLARESQAIPLQIQEESKGRGRTAGGVAPLETSALRQNTIKALGLSAIGATLQGNISLAEQNIQRALDAEFEPLRTKLESLKQLYSFNKDILEREDKKRADNLNILIGERTRLLENEKAEKEGIYNVGLLAQKYGAPSDVVQSIFEATDRSRAVLSAGKYLQDPKAKIDLQNAMLDTQIKKVELSKKAKELEILTKYGGLTPEQWEKKKKEELANLDSSQAKTVEIRNSIDQIGTILGSKALDSVVGPTVFARSAFRRTKGEKYAPPIAGITGVFDEVTGLADDTVSLTEQLLSQGFLDKLIATKGEGATFGQLSNQEGASLRAAANAIGQTAIKNEDEKVIGYDMSESEFKKQMAIVQERLNYLHIKTTGKAFGDEEENILNTAFGDLEFNPAF